MTLFVELLQNISYLAQIVPKERGIVTLHNLIGNVNTTIISSKHTGFVTILKKMRTNKLLEHLIAALWMLKIYMMYCLIKLTYMKLVKTRADIVSLTQYLMQL